MIKLIDTHTHINCDDFKDDPVAAIARAKDAGVQKIVLANVDANSIESMMTLVRQYPDFVFPMIGLHPTEIPENYHAVLEMMHGLLNKTKFVAIGEIGFDLYWDNTKYDLQKEVFKIQYEWAKEFDLPINIHIRNAFDELFSTLEEIGDSSYRGILHCFSGNEEQARRCLDYGFCLGIGGIVTFKKSEIGEVLKKCVPLDRIVLETDAPWLTPVPFRGKNNEPAYLKYVADKLAELYACTTEKIGEITSHTAELVYNI